jgi:hypothetical protein
MRTKANCYRACVLLSSGLFLLGCGSSRYASPNGEMGAVSDSLSTSAKTRRVIQTASIRVDVDEPQDFLKAVTKIVKDKKGFVQNSTVSGNSSLYLTCRVPSKDLKAILDQVGALGSEDQRVMSATDVTDQYNDLSVRLKNSKALRGRYKQLLQRAKNVQDVLSIEKELNRIQSEIESMQAQFDSLKSRVELSTLSITLRKTKILGPLGYVGYGLWYGIKVLFVIQ